MQERDKVKLKTRKQKNQKQKNQKKKNRIGLLNEGSLHSQIKNYYAVPGDCLETTIDGFVIDIVRGSLLIEIQTGYFSKIKRKLLVLLKNHKVRLIYPIPRIKWIVYIDPATAHHIKKRKSPKQGSALEIFSELIRIPTLINKRGLHIELLMTEEEEIRCDDGKGSWRRRGMSIIERRLVKVHDSLLLKTKKDFLQFLPTTLPSQFTNKILAQHQNCNTRKAAKITYCLKKMGIIEESGKAGRSIAYKLKKK